MRARFIALSVGIALAMAVSLGVSPALADKAEQTPAAATAPASDTGASPGKAHSRRPWVYGLIAAAFVIFSGLVGANDKQKKAQSQRPPPAA